MAGKAAIHIEFRNSRDDMEAKIDSIQMSLEHAPECIRAVDSERVELLASEKSLKRKLQLSSDDNRKVENFKNRLDGAVAKQRWSETIIESFQDHLLSL